MSNSREGGQKPPPPTENDIGPENVHGEIEQMSESEKKFAAINPLFKKGSRFKILVGPSSRNPFDKNMIWTVVDISSYYKSSTMHLESGTIRGLRFSLDDAKELVVEKI